MATGVTKNVNTKNLSGLSISRSGSKFIFEWKQTDDNYNAGQQLQYRFIYTVYTKSEWTRRKTDWTSVSIGYSTTKKAISPDLTIYSPYHKRHLIRVEFRIRGKRSQYTKTRTSGGTTYTDTYIPGWSDWKYKDYDLNVPKNPSVSSELDSELMNRSTFSWETETSTTDSKHFVRVEWQSILKRGCTQTDGSKISWSGCTTGSGGASSSKVITEDTDTLKNGSYTRWFRAQSVGARGYGDWKYAKHVYAIPHQAVISSASVEETNADGLRCKVIWKADSNAAYPIDSTVVQYCIGVPAAGLEVDNGATWTDTPATADTKDSDALVFYSDEVLGTDQCLFVRVNTKHDSNTTYGVAKLCAIGKLGSPTFGTISTDSSTYRATITATNTSSVTDSFLVITYVPAAGEGDPMIVGIIPNGSTSTTVQCPEWTDAPGFTVYAAVGSYAVVTRADGVSNYTVDAKMVSDTVSDGGSVPQAPTNVEAEQTDAEDTIRVTWDWDWTSATSAELSWADHADAWESTAEPTTYEISNLYKGAWNISGLDVGTWYIRVRLFNESNDSRVYSPYSDITTVDLSSEPNVPLLSLSSAIIVENGSVTASWAYTSTDGTAQDYAEICEATYGTGTVVDESTGEVEYGDLTYSDDMIAHAETAQSVTIYHELTGWTTGTTHLLCLRVKSASGKYSDWSDPVPVLVAEPLEAEITSTSLVDGTITGDEIGLEDDSLSLVTIAVEDYYGNEESYGILTTSSTDSSITIDDYTFGVVTIGVTDYEGNATTVNALTTTDDFPTVTISAELDGTTASVTVIGTAVAEGTILQSMPMTVTVTGAGDTGTTTVIIERAEAYHMDRPDESVFNGHDGETIYIGTQTGEDAFTINTADLIGSLDDGAKYRLLATVSDSYGQRADADPIDFTVYWTHQAEAPTATIELDDDVVQITPVAPDGYEDGDTCDIYRLSADRPELIIKDGTFGTTYVDPYPAIGEFGGHRIVHKTYNGDYITGTNTPAWIDYEDGFESDYTIIDFDGRQAVIVYNEDLSSSWEKDFQETKYLGGSIQGDWNPAVSRSTSIGTVAVIDTDQELLTTMRRLATYPGICHVRTQDGSSYAADIQVTEDRTYQEAGMLATFKLSITRVDPEEPEGVTLAQWEGDE